MASPTIPYSEIKPSWLSQKLPEIPLAHIQRALFVGIIACAIISLIPNLGWIGSLSTRSLSIAMTSVQTLHLIKNNKDKKQILLNIMRLACVVLGLAGVATHINALSIGALAGDMFFQMVEAGRGAKEKDIYKSLSHFSFLLIDAFAMTALLTGGWQFATTAASLSATAMIVFGLKAICDACRKQDLNYVIDAVSYFALAGIGIASAVRSAEILSNKYVRSFYVYKNNTGQEVTFYDKNGNLVAKVEPGEIASFDVAAENTYGDGFIVKMTGDVTEKFSPVMNQWADVVIQKSMTVAEFPTLPIDSGAVVLEEPKWNEPDPFEIDQDTMRKLDRFISPTHDEATSCLAQANEPQVIFKNRRNSEWKRFEMEALCGLSTKISMHANWRGNKNSYKEQAVLQQHALLNENPREGCDRLFEVDIPPALFTLLMEFFSNGLLNLRGVNEWELVQLNNIAVQLKIERLEKISCQEIARRLKACEWENTALFHPFIDQDERLLSSLLALFNFEEGNDE